MAYLHFEVTAQQSRKHASICGDAWRCDRNPGATTIIVADGIGSGVHAGVAANMCLSRLHTLLDQDFSPRQAFTRMVETMNRWRDPSHPYAAFAVLRIRSSGEASFMGYDFPPPILLSVPIATVLNCTTVSLGGGLISEAHTTMTPQDALLLVSDGITQAGLGLTLPEGWTIDGVASATRQLLRDGNASTAIPELLLEQARQFNGGRNVDDVTALLAVCRRGCAANVMTGPPLDRKQNRKWVQRFLAADGCRIVCGATTAKIVAEIMGTTLSMQPDECSMLAPPRYSIAGIDLVTEGAVTLNQLYNVLDADPSQFGEESGVTCMHELLSAADRVHFFLGCVSNPANADIAFQQRGVLNRTQIVPLICDKLRKAGKLVILDSC